MNSLFNIIYKLTNKSHNSVFLKNMKCSLLRKKHELLHITHTAIYKQTPILMQLTLTNNRTLISSNKLTLNAPVFSQTAFLHTSRLYGMDYHPNYNKNQTSILSTPNYIIS